jgi:C4-dicarboxylate transporter DctM subunit
MILLLFGSFFFLLILKMPVIFAIGLSSLFAILWQGDTTLMLLAQRTIASLDSFPLLAVPLFILMGEILNRGGCGEKLVKFSEELVGGVTGGLAHANVLTSMFFGGISGVATADTAAIGSVMIPMMKRAGYDVKFSTVITITSSIIGIIIPPSINMILYGWVSGTSIVQLFAGGIIPGILVGLSLMAVSHWISIKRGYRSAERFSFKRLFKAFIAALPALIMPIIILGGIFGGAFTTTEAASVAVIYGIFISIFFYKGFKFKEIPSIFLKVSTTVGSIMFLIAICKTFGWIITAEQIPHAISGFFLTYLPHRSVFLLNIILPVAISMGIDPVHFGLVLICSLAIGHVTPPVGLTLFIGSEISGVPVSQLLKPLLPFLLVLIGLALVVAYVPWLTLFIPSLLK